MKVLVLSFLALGLVAADQSPVGSPIVTLQEAPSSQPLDVPQSPLTDDRHIPLSFQKSGMHISAIKTTIITKSSKKPEQDAIKAAAAIQAVEPDIFEMEL